MEVPWLWMVMITCVGVYIFVFGIVKNINQWFYVERVKHKLPYPLPPGHMGWPFLGNHLSFLTAFKSQNPDSFINNLVSRYRGSDGMYKSHLFGSPSVVLCKAELCRMVISDDQHFKIGYPKSLLELTASRTFTQDSIAQHKRIRRLTTSPIVGHAPLAMYVERIEDIMVNSLDEWASMCMSMNQPIPLLNELKRVTFKVIVHIFIGSNNNHSIISKIGDLYSYIHTALFGLPINVPGFAYHKALKARRKLERIILSVVEERRMMMKTMDGKEGKKDLLDILLDVEDENGMKLEDEDIVDLSIGFLFAGYTIPKGWKVLLWLRALHLDPENFSDPLQFNPSRWDDYSVKPKSYLAFGGGLRLCPGLDLRVGATVPFSEAVDDLHFSKTAQDRPTPVNQVHSKFEANYDSPDFSSEGNAIANETGKPFNPVPIFISNESADCKGAWVTRAGPVTIQFPPVRVWGVPSDKDGVNLRAKEVRGVYIVGGDVQLDPENARDRAVLKKMGDGLNGVPAQRAVKREVEASVVEQIATRKCIQGTIPKKIFNLAWQLAFQTQLSLLGGELMLSGWIFRARR
ncbi:beta-amyrin 11-oxidase-like [Senna tora]|uniref:Beta-amyrin 11-oxidase-like n=1 Tax=Senna tora TaxID=362788 RepID=A0A834TXF9_9FABA|nr:beta-amyrin 11-oxidase-like [Senna tora]